MKLAGPGVDLTSLITTSPQAKVVLSEQRRELLSAALTHLEAAAKLLQAAEEQVLADEARELTDKVDVVALAEAA
jgi:hypothetical protein